jgi:uncharacterized membrane protein YfcA
MLDLIVTFAIAMLSGLGVGSAGLLVAWFSLVRDMPHLSAQALNLVFFLCSAGAALTVHTLRTPPKWRYVLLLLPTGIAGSLLGAHLTALLPRSLLRMLFGAFLIVIGARGLLKGSKAKKKIAQKPTRRL